MSVSLRTSRLNNILYKELKKQNEEYEKEDKYCKENNLSDEERTQLEKNPHWIFIHIGSEYITPSTLEEEAHLYFMMKFPSDYDKDHLKNAEILGYIKFPKRFPDVAPDIIFLTEIGLFIIGKPICIMEFSGFHNSSFKKEVVYTNVLTSIMLDYIDTKDIKSAIGYNRGISDEAVKNHVRDSREYNKKNLVKVLKYFDRFNDLEEKKELEKPKDFVDDGEMGEDDPLADLF